MFQRYGFHPSFRLTPESLLHFDVAAHDLAEVEVRLFVLVTAQGRYRLGRQDLVATREIAADEDLGRACGRPP